MVGGDVDLSVAAPFGCSVQTGAGTVMNVLELDERSSLVVFGAGGVGLPAVMAARALGVRRSSSSTRSPAAGGSPSSWAPPPPSTRRSTTSSRRSATTRAAARRARSRRPRSRRCSCEALDCLGARGTCVALGVGMPEFAFGMERLARGKSLRTAIEGDADPHELIPRLLELHARGELPVERLIRTYRSANSTARCATPSPARRSSRCSCSSVRSTAACASRRTPAGPRRSRPTPAAAGRRSSSRASASSTLCCRPSSAASFVSWTESGEHSRISAAHRSAAGIRSASGTTSLTSPIRCASSAPKMRPVSSRPSASLNGSCRASRWTPPAPANRPTRGSGSPNRAWSAAMMMSHASASSRPPPTATPLTAAIIGFGQWKSRVMRPNGGRASPWTSPPLAVRCAVTLRSLPAENARSPDPVRIATQESGSSRKSSQISASSR